MINIYFLPILVLFTIFLVAMGIKRAASCGAFKIRRFSILLFALALLHYISIIILMLSKNILFLYTLKVFFYLNYLYIPFMAITAVYIIVRKDNIKFINIIYIFVLLTCIYSYIMVTFVNNLILYRNLAYIMYLHNHEFIFLFILLINIFFLLLGLAFLKKGNIEKLGAYLVVLASLIAVYEILLVLLGKSIFQENIISDFIWIITFVHTLKQLRKNN